MKHDFEGWVTRNNLKCSDGRTIKHGAFISQDGSYVPLVWNHEHKTPSNVLGKVLLKNRDEGVYGYGAFNDTDSANHAKQVLKHGDITNLSIWANNVQESDNGDVFHGVIREVSLVLAGANPGAFIESVVSHGEPMLEGEGEGIFYNNDKIVVSHGEVKTQTNEEEDKTQTNEEDKTVREVFETMTDEQKAASALLAQEMVKSYIEENKKDEKKEEEEVKHNIFDGEVIGAPRRRNYIAHADQVKILEDAKKNKASLKETIQYHLESGILSHSDIDFDGMELSKGEQDYGINDMSMFFPDYKALDTTPEFISRDMSWVAKVNAKVRKIPFSRIKSLFANITEDEARAKGYLKANQKKEEVFSTLKRTTDPQTFYKLQKLDRDDIIDVTTFDVVVWLKKEMEMMMDEEKARAILIGDGRSADAEDKIQELHIRPVVKDVPLFNTVILVESGANDNETTKNIIRAIVKARKKYKGTGKPDFWTTEDVITDMLLLEDANGRAMYETEDKLATKLRVAEIIPVEPMEGYTITYDNVEYPLIGTITNLVDYTVGADKGGERNFFDDFDIDFNQQKYLMEERASGALTKPFSAVTIALKKPIASGGASSYSTRSYNKTEEV